MVTPTHTASEIPEFDDATLAALTAAELVDTLIQHEDRVPRKLIDECVSRGEAMLDALTPLAQPNDELEESSPGHWWLRLHAVMILGLIPGERSGRLLVEYIHGMCRQEDENLQEWFAGYWPALLRNKPYSMASPLQDICRDRKVGWFMRANIIEAVIDLARRQGEEALEQTLDRAAQQAADEEEDWDYRLSVANDLLDFPRDRYRDLLNHLAERQKYIGRHFDTADINKVYANKTDKPDWERFGNPWRFYEETEIRARQQRWNSEEPQRQGPDEWLSHLLEHESLSYVQSPYEREAPKTGRNDPCPCGSGKKYKKCCMGKK